MRETIDCGIYGACEVVRKNYRLKKAVLAWALTYRELDMDIRTEIPEGSEVTVARDKDGRYIAVRFEDFRCRDHVKVVSDAFDGLSKSAPEAKPEEKIQAKDLVVQDTVSFRHSVHTTNEQFQLVEETVTDEWRFAGWVVNRDKRTAVFSEVEVGVNVYLMEQPDGSLINAIDGRTWEILSVR